MKSDSDWQDAAFNTRHLHNRNDRGGQAGNTRHEFQIRNTFGTHLVKCAVLDKLQDSETAQKNSKKRRGSGNTKAGSDVVLDIYRLTDDEDGLLGSLKCPGVFEATVVFAGSRKLLWKITHSLGGPDLDEASASQGSLPTQTKRRGSKQDEATTNGFHRDEQDYSSDEETEDDDSGSGSEARQRRRIAKFEKNSFRQPKFWFRWQGNMVDDIPTPLEDLGLTGGSKVHGSGYVVFSANDCKRFQGTLTSEQLAWNNVKMTGFKTKPQPERDFEIQWTEP